MKQITLTVDDLDAAMLHRAITDYQRRNRDRHGVILPDGESDLPGAILAEICRDWIDMVNLNK